MQAIFVRFSLRFFVFMFVLRLSIFPLQIKLRLVLFPNIDGRITGRCPDQCARSELAPYGVRQLIQLLLPFLFFICEKGKLTSSCAVNIRQGNAQETERSLSIPQLVKKLLA